MNVWENQIINRLRFIYKDKITQQQINKILKQVENNAANNNELSLPKWSHQDIALITYGDSVLDEQTNPLESLNAFLNDKLKGAINTVHILPFFPYSSDDGFSIIDFKAVNPDLGNWNDVQKIASRYNLMVDLVINHASSKSQWFHNFINANGEGKDYFIVEKPETDLSQVTRPRSTPLLTAYETKQGVKHVWTTFSADQIDLNFSNPDLLIAMFDIFIHYLKHGAKIIRLDAIAFLWKEIGTSCLHLKQTHEVVKLMRNVGEIVAPGIIILTETNVPNNENLSYFGNNDEAHMVYQFSLPPLLLHALNAENSQYLSTWVASIPDMNENCTFFNFTSSHDGIGVRPLEGLLPDNEKQLLFNDIKKSGGLISMKSNADGSTSPYELNITYFDSLKRTRKGTDEFQAQRFICSQTIMLELKGLPAFYIHSLLASPNYLKGVDSTGRARSINREKLHKRQLYIDLESNSLRSTIFNELIKLIKLRKAQSAFHPSAKQQVLNYGKYVFVLLRLCNDQNILCISNITNTNYKIQLNNSEQKYNFDIISDKHVNLAIVLEPYQTVWLINK